MAKAIVDPADLRRFAHTLKHFNNELYQQMSVLQGQLAALGDTWRDQEHERFVQEFSETMQVLGRFVEAANQHVPYLVRKAERIEEYLQQRWSPPMSESARVTSVEALQTFREALCVFSVEAQQALGSADMEVRRTLDALQARLQYWQREVRERQEEVVRAKTALVQRRWGHTEGRGPGTTEQEMALRKALQRLQEAEAKVETTRRWLQRLPQEVREYEGPARQLAGFLEGDLRNATAILGRKIEALEAYVQVAPSPGVGPDPAAPSSPAATEEGETAPGGAPAPGPA